MTERVGIPRAVDSAGRTFDRTAIERVPQPFDGPLRCAGCTTVVQAVHGYPRRNGTLVDPYYRLTHRTEAPHDPHCRYDFDARVGRLHEEHRSALTKDGDVYELRLPETDTAPPGAALLADTRSDGRDRLTIHPRRGHTLAPVLSAAAAIAAMISTYDDDPQARARFAARWKGERIAWEDFYFDVAQDARRLARVVAGRDHPVAVSGHVKRVGRTARDTADVVELATGRGVTHPPNGRWIHVRLMSKAPGALPREVGQRVLGYGRWEHFEPEDSDNHYVNLWVDHASSVTTTR
ncbi:hypothetical protein [Janibacter sp. UYMM211]|uniref:hypothetical protein n=1 Tax=Janibacter sp. UYMM211 TaxID=3156342 RepID=UPI0033935D0F